MNSFAEALKQWRKAQGLSQLALSFEAEISAKHISFLETGRARPSREMVIHLSNILNVPLSQRNTLLSLAGFSEAYSRMSLDQVEMQPVRQALSLMLDKHVPYPAVVLDWDWDIVMANEPYTNLGLYMATQQTEFTTSNNIIELLFDPKGFRPFVENWEEVAFVLMQRVHRDRLMHKDRHSDLVERLMQYPGVPRHWKVPDIQNQPMPMINVVLLLGGKRLAMFSTLTAFGTPIDITMQELIIEQYFPADDVCKNFFETQAYLQLQ